MHRLGLSHLVFSLVAAAVFVAMGVMARPFPPTAQWFPLYVSIFGTGLSVAAAVASAISVVRSRASRARGQADGLDEVTEPASVLGGAPADAQEGGERPAAEAAAPATAAPATAAPAQEDEDDEGGQSMTWRGFAWLGAWLAFVVVALLIGFVPAAGVWLLIWFRVVHKWNWAVVIPVVVGVVALLIFAEQQLDIGMPGPQWTRTFFRW